MPRIQTLKQLQNLKNFGKFFNAKTITNSVVKTLAQEGKRIIKEAYEQKNWNNRTYNLYNSYVSAVIVNGKIRSIMYLGPEHAPTGLDDAKPKSSAWTSATERHIKGIDVERGRREANNFVLSYASQHKKGVILVVGAAMFYAGILESKGYHVISNISTNLRDISANGLFLTDFKVGNLFQDFKEGSDAKVMIGKDHIAFRGVELSENHAGRSTTFWTK